VYCDYCDNYDKASEKLQHLVTTNKLVQQFLNVRKREVMDEGLCLRAAFLVLGKSFDGLLVFC
jgi:hypothetical protein